MGGEADEKDETKGRKHVRRQAPCCMLLYTWAGDRMLYYHN
jgi:hypothetical protein